MHSFVLDVLWSPQADVMTLVLPESLRSLSTDKSASHLSLPLFLCAGKSERASYSYGRDSNLHGCHQVSGEIVRFLVCGTSTWCPVLHLHSKNADHCELKLYFFEHKEESVTHQLPLSSCKSLASFPVRNLPVFL